MKIAILTNSSDNIKELSEITLANKSGYANKHGYTLYCYNFDYENYNEAILDLMRQDVALMRQHDVVMTMGADTMFMNWNIRIEDVLEPHDHIVVSRERTTWWPINNDVMIYRCTPQTIAFYERMMSDFDVWRQYPWRQQAHLWNLIQEDPAVAKLIRLVEPSVMNQHPTRWQLGEWITHMYNMPVEDKVKQARIFANNWPDGQPVWKVKMDGVKPRTA